MGSFDARAAGTHPVALTFATVSVKRPFVVRQAIPKQPFPETARIPRCPTAPKP